LPGLYGCLPTKVIVTMHFSSPKGT
jgi:hypothetical protein